MNKQGLTICKFCYSLVSFHFGVLRIRVNVCITNLQRLTICNCFHLFVSDQLYVPPLSKNGAMEVPNYHILP